MNNEEKDLENKIKMNQAMNNEMKLSKAKLLLALANLSNKAKKNTRKSKNAEK